MRASISIPISISIVLALATYAVADDTFEGKATGAEPIAHLDDLVWATSATCDKGDDVLQRQCKKLRDARLAQLAGKPLLLELGELGLGAWNSAKKSAEITISGCIACGGANGTHVIAGAVAIEGGKPAPRAIVNRALPFETEALRNEFAKSLKGSRTQIVVTLASPAKFDSGGVKGIRVDVLAYRTFTPCDGKIVVAAPASSPLAANPKACSK